MTVNPGVGPVVRQRLRLSRRQKVGIFGVGTALVLGGLMAVHLFSGSPKQEDAGQQFAGTAGMPFTAPTPLPAPAPKQVSFTPSPTPAAQPPTLPVAASPAPPSDDKGLTSAIFSDAGAHGPEAASNVQRGSGGSGGAKDDLSAALVHSDLGATAHATIMKHPSLTIPAGTVIPCILQTAIYSELAGFVDCTVPAEVRGATGTVTLLDRGTQVFGEIKSGLREGQSRPVDPRPHPRKRGRYLRQPGRRRAGPGRGRWLCQRSLLVEVWGGAAVFADRLRPAIGCRGTPAQ